MGSITLKKRRKQFQNLIFLPCFLKKKGDEKSRFARFYFYKKVNEIKNIFFKSNQI